MAEYHSFYCPRCKKYTRQEKITAEEQAWLEEGERPSLGWRLFFNVFEPITEPIIKLTAGEISVKCTHCGLATLRKLNGDLAKKPRENGKNLDL